MMQTGGEERAEVRISWGALSWGMLLKGPGRAAGRAGPPFLLHLTSLGLWEPPVLQTAQATQSSQGSAGGCSSAARRGWDTATAPQAFPDTRVLSNSELQLTPTPNEPWGGSLGLITGAH